MRAPVGAPSCHHPRTSLGCCRFQGPVLQTRLLPASISCLAAPHAWPSTWSTFPSYLSASHVPLRLISRSPLAFLALPFPGTGPEGWARHCPAPTAGSPACGGRNWTWGQHVILALWPGTVGLPGDASSPTRKPLTAHLRVCTPNPRATQGTCTVPGHCPQAVQGTLIWTPTARLSALWGETLCSSGAVGFPTACAGRAAGASAPSVGGLSHLLISSSLTVQHLRKQKDREAAVRSGAGLLAGL